MTNYPTQLDEIDQWLADNFGIVAGACSSTENLRYNTAKMVAEVLWPKSVEEDLEKASDEYAYTNWESEDYHTGASDGLPFDPIGHTKKTFIAGANWQKCKDSLHIPEICKENGDSFTNDTDSERNQVDKLEKVAEEYAKDETMAGLAERAFKAGANWQKEQDKETIELAEDHAMLAGMVKKEEEMKEKALELTVYLDDDGYPCIPEIVLFDFDKNQPTAKEGDKVNVCILEVKPNYEQHNNNEENHIL